jgi:hypothetical protein
MPLRVAKLTFRRRPMCATLAFASRRVISSRRTIRPFLREESAECVPFQEEVGLDVLVHGQFQHNDTVEYFGQIERLHLSVTNSFSRQPLRIRPSLPSKNIGKREGRGKSWRCAARTRSDDYQRKIKPFFGPYQLRKLPEA